MRVLACNNNNDHNQREKDDDDDDESPSIKFVYDSLSIYLTLMVRTNTNISNKLLLKHERADIWNRFLRCNMKRKF